MTLNNGIRNGTRLASLIVAALSTAALPAAADPGRGHGKDRGAHSGQHANAGHCPPGLAKKNPPCVPPGQARQSSRGHASPGVGDVLRVGDYVLIRDPRRHDLETRDGWRYYRDGDRAYRVDPDTRRVLAVLNLIDAFTN